MHGVQVKDARSHDGKEQGGRWAEEQERAVDREKPGEGRVGANRGQSFADRAWRRRARVLPRARRAYRDQRAEDREIAESVREEDAGVARSPAWSSPASAGPTVEAPVNTID